MTELPALYDGSSPRMRGTGSWGPQQLGDRRFIPAHAGNRCWANRSFRHQVVHPRACGEQPTGQGGTRYDIGSSPRMRGTVARHLHHPLRDRFIPAHAGNRLARYEPRLRTAVHPRACGEQPVAFAGPLHIAGSSPRMRGTVAASLLNEGDQRFIPAHAGNRRYR